MSTTTGHSNGSRKDAEVWERFLGTKKMIVFIFFFFWEQVPEDCKWDLESENLKVQDLDVDLDEKFRSTFRSSSTWNQIEESKPA